MIEECDKNLGYLGVDFQRSLVKSMIEDRHFLNKVIKVVEPNQFTDDYLRLIVGTLVDYLRVKPQNYCGYSEIEYILKSKNILQERLNETLNTLKYIETEVVVQNFELINNTAERFFKQQNLTKALVKSMELIRKGGSDNYDSIENIIKDALNVNLNEDEGYIIFDNIEDCLKDDFRETIPTGFDFLDERLEGGISKGELGLIIAPTGTGKTSTTTGFASFASTYKCRQNDYKGYKVLHIHFEDQPVNIRRKYIGNKTGYDPATFKDNNVKDNIRKYIETCSDDEVRLVNENIRAIRPKSGEFTVTDLRNLINRFKAKGFHPDLVIIDYFECLKHEKLTDGMINQEYSREGYTMRKLETLANEYNIGIWCPIQGTKDSINQRVVGINQGGGSVQKIQIGHIILTLSRTEEQAVNDRININIGKFRAGKNGGRIENVMFNNGNCTFSIDEASTLNGLPINNLKQYDSFNKKNAFDDGYFEKQKLMVNEVVSNFNKTGNITLIQENATTTSSNKAQTQTQESEKMLCAKEIVDMCDF